jgi:hypothetical protein
MLEIIEDGPNGQRSDAVADEGFERTSVTKKNSLRKGNTPVIVISGFPRNRWKPRHKQSLTCSP